MTEYQILLAVCTECLLHLHAKGPEHAHLKDSGRATYVSVTDTEALEGFKLMSQVLSAVFISEICFAYTTQWHSFSCSCSCSIFGSRLIYNLCFRSFRLRVLFLP